MGSRTTDLAKRIRDRIGERVLAGTPLWLTPVFPAARSSALSLLVGNLTGRLPAEDAVALCRTVVTEQNPDGSWSLQPEQPGDLATTLEILEALTRHGEPSWRDSLAKAVAWLESRSMRGRLNEETFLLLAALTDALPRRIRRWIVPAAKMFLPGGTAQDANRRRTAALKEILSVLSRERAQAVGTGRKLLELQLLDGSWEGSCRTTALALVALRHASLPIQDAAFERGWHFLRTLQVWDGDRLVQNPCDLSNILHATAARTLLVTGAEPDIAAASSLSLLHQCRRLGGWSAGGLLAVDLFSTSLVLDALSFAGDIPVETAWARRRAVMLLLRTQNTDGGWPLYLQSKRFRELLAHRGSVSSRASRVDVTALALQALAYSGVRGAGEQPALRRAVRFLVHRQQGDGMWRSDVQSSSVFTTARSVEALMGIGDDRATLAAMRAVQALATAQRDDGGWSEHHDAPSTPYHTAWVLRALSGIPAVQPLVQQRARRFLERSLDASELVWNEALPVLSLPMGEVRVAVPELTTLWALEALAPAGVPARVRTTGMTRSRGIFDRSR